jgi:putative RNA 2'-phosphotransferase
VTDPVARCADHGAFEGARCPACGARGERLLDGDRRRRLSKFLSGALRHFPDDAGLSLDDRGWAALDAAWAAVEARFDWADRRAVAAVVATDPKGRFERDGDRLRAAYGHSVPVDLGPTDAPVPDRLYHGTDPANLPAVREEGLRPMGRRLVHLSGSREVAREVGRRHADDPAVLVVDAAAMLADGRRVTGRGEGVYTAERVPPAYLKL